VGLNVDQLPAWLRPRAKIRRQVAVALGYQPGPGRVPEVLARGFGRLAEHIVELARARSVPVREDADLAEVLARLDVGADIPEELYQAVAEILAFIYRMNAVYPRSPGA
jgi:flagellar biosynthesis protein